MKKNKNEEAEATIDERHLWQQQSVTVWRAIVDSPHTNMWHSQN